jgi:hypothetical protein
MPGPLECQLDRIKTLMVRSASSRVSNHEARLVASSFETRLTPLLRMRG